MQFYYKKDAKDSQRRYLKNNEKSTVERLCQKDYDQKVLEAAKKELHQLEKLKKGYPKAVYEEIYDTLSSERKMYTHPIVLSDAEFIEKWKQMEYQGKGFKEKFAEFYTDNGERVRSKSEILIANALKKHGIPYRYEAPIYLNGFGVIYPDFTVLNIRLRKEMYWEHLGMVDKEDYLEDAFYRLGMYENNNIFVGDKIILSHESLKYPLNTRNIEKLIFQYLK